MDHPEFFSFLGQVGLQLKDVAGAVGGDERGPTGEDLLKWTMSLNPGDMAVPYTDGITESRSKKNQEFDEEKLLGFLKQNSKLEASIS